MLLSLGSEGRCCMTSWRRALGIGGLVLAIGIIGGLQFLTAPGDSTDSKIVEIAPGSSLHDVISVLSSQGLLKHPTLFEIVARMTGQDRKIIPGEYRLHSDMSPLTLLSYLVEGRVLQHAVTIPEGFTMVQIAELLDEHGLTNRHEFLRVCRDASFIRTLGIGVPTNAPSLEGYLFPDTYFLTRRMSPHDIVRMFVRRFNKVFTEELRMRARDIGLTVHEVLTLASIIEKETSLPEERPVISGVFHNRLRRRMPLQSDPTVIYALKEFDGNLRKQDLVLESPYNTYRVIGLPPGPIANPGKAAILAALYPQETDYVYFVSRNDGSHQFSVTLAEHNAAVERYQRAAMNQAS
ncbi:MAG: endolytic transglycosylase MltG [Nitrospirae bacterium]|nr:MAG: endolytic transglycosylase MltG [Nitrospirota bacterium]